MINAVLGALFKNLFGAILEGWRMRQEKAQTFEAGATAAALNASRKQVARAARAGDVIRAVERMNEKELRTWL